MILIDEKLVRRQAEIGKYRYRKILELKELEFAEDEVGGNGVYPGDDLAFQIKLYEIRSFRIIMGRSGAING